MTAVYIFAHLRKFGLCMHVGRGNAASKTEAMYFPPPRMAYEAAIPGVRRPVFIRVRTAYSIAAT